MIYHSVLFKIKEQTSSDDIKKMISNLNGLSGQIQDIKFISVNHNFSSRSKGYNVVLMSAFDNTEALERYQKHPAHVAVVEQYVKPILEDLVVGDIEA